MKQQVILETVCQYYSYLTVGGMVVSTKALGSIPTLISARTRVWKWKGRCSSNHHPHGKNHHFKLTVKENEITFSKYTSSPDCVNNRFIWTTCHCQASGFSTVFSVLTQLHCLIPLQKQICHIFPKLHETVFGIVLLSVCYQTRSSFCLPHIVLLHYSSVEQPRVIQRSQLLLVPNLPQNHHHGNFLSGAVIRHEGAPPLKSVKNTKLPQLCVHAEFEASEATEAERRNTTWRTTQTFSSRSPNKWQDKVCFRLQGLKKISHMKSLWNSRVKIDYSTKELVMLMPLQWLASLWLFSFQFAVVVVRRSQTSY